MTQFSKYGNNGTSKANRVTDETGSVAVFSIVSDYTNAHEF